MTQAKSSARNRLQAGQSRPLASLLLLLLLALPHGQPARASYLSATQTMQQQQQQFLSINNQQQSAAAEPQAPSIIPFNFNQNVQENQRASVMCTTSSGETPVSFAWLKDGQTLGAQVAQTRRITIKPDQDSSTLKISSVRLDHAGNYTCVAKNRFGSQLHSAQLVVHVEPRWLREPQLEPIVATRGQTVVIDCQTTGWPRPQQTWQIKTHNQGEFEPLASVGHGRLSLAPNGSLVIRNADKSDEANYLCKSSNGIGKGLSWSTSLKVTVPAHFEAPKQQTTTTIRKGGQVQLRCDAYGDQPITIEWLRNKQPLAPAGGADASGSLSDVRYSIHSNNNPLKTGLISQLSIRQAARQDNSLFECVTKNPYGRDRLAMELVVQEEPDNIQELQVTQVSSRAATLMWNEPYDGRAPITSYMFQYKRVQQSEAAASLGPAAQLAGGGAIELDSYLDSLSPLAGQPVQAAAGGKSSSGELAQGDWQQASRIVLATNASAAGPAPGGVRSITIERLEPSSKYILRALAVNHVGQSKFSQPMEFSTDEEAPEVGPVNIRAQALNSTSIQVSWDEIPRARHLGRIHGYYVGYRVANNNSAAATFIYKPYIISDLLGSGPAGGPQGHAGPQGQADALQQQVIPSQQQSRLETVIQDLRRDTIYEITVVAFNSRGSGPSSDFVVCRTIEMEAPQAVKLAIRRESNEFISVEWQRDPGDQNPVDDYVLYQEKNSATQEWLQVRLPSNQTHYRASDLKCGTRYQFYIIAHNKVGKSAPSEVVSASISGALPVIPSKTRLLKWVNSTCLLVNLNSFQDNGCRIKTFTVRYREDKRHQQQQQVAPDGQSGQATGSPAGAQSGASASTANAAAGQLVNSNGVSASEQALSSASQGQLKTLTLGSGGGGGGGGGGQSNSATPAPSGEWTAIKPKSNLKQQRANEEDRLEYLCDLEPAGEYTVHVAASNDIGRSEIEYTVLMSSDELRHSLWKDWLELVSGLPNVFAYVPSILVFLLAALSLAIVCLILYTTAIKYYQKFVIMQNQMRATRRAKADEKRRRKLLGQSMSSSSRHSQKMAELWADEYEREDEDDDEDGDEQDLRMDTNLANYQGDRERIIGSSEDSLGDIDDGDDEDETTATEELQSSGSSQGGRRQQVRCRRQQQQQPGLKSGKQSHCRRGQAAVRRNNTIQPVRSHHHLHQLQHPAQYSQLALNPHLQRRQLHQHSGSNPHQGHYLANLSSSAFDSSSVDLKPYRHAAGASAKSQCKPFNGSDSACMSTASTESIHGRFQCLSAKQYVKMNEYTMLPTVSARLSSPSNETIYGSAQPAMALQAQHSSPVQFAHRPMNGASPSANSSASNTTSSQTATSGGSGPAVAARGGPQNASSLYYSTLRRTSMQTYLPQQPQRQQINRRPSQNMADIYGYYMAPPGQARATVAAQQAAANEAANSIFVPPQQIIYSAPNIRRQPPVFL